MPHPFDLVMFDLDGTLIDSLPAIAAAANGALVDLGLPTIETHRFRQLAGQGLPYLIREILGSEHARRFDEAQAAHLKHYREHARDLAHVFAGVDDLLHALAKAKLPFAVLSNKPHADTCDDVSRMMERHAFAAVMGHRDGHAVKPDPASALEICSTLHIEPARVLYVGDTAADMQTAVNAGFYALGVTYGFRSRQELEAHGARQTVDHVMDVFSVAQPA
ncbi:MAG: HAD family hydrolase [Algisphaera sp.]